MTKQEWLENVEFIAHLSSVTDVAESAIDAVKRGRGWSLLRLGDGEMQLFQSLKAGFPGGVVKDAKDGSPGRWKNRFMPNVHWEEAAKSLLAAIPRATFLGLPYAAYWKPGQMGVQDVLAGYGIDWKGLRLTGTALPQILCARPDLMRHMSGNVKVGLAYRHVDIGRDAFLKAKLPLHEQFKYEGQPHSEVVEFFQSKRCDLVWMCGGPYGKACCVELADAGMVAVDIGQGIEKSLVKGKVSAYHA